MNYYAALDVSLRSVHLCVVDEDGELITETKLSSEVTDIIACLDDLDAGAAQFFTNAGKTKTDGIEAVLSWLVPTDNGIFRLDATGAFINTDVSDDVNTDGLLEGLEEVIFTAQDRSIIEECQPDKNLIGQSRSGTIPGIVDSPGVFTYSRRAAPFGFNGGYWYVKALYRF